MNKHVRMITGAVALTVSFSALGGTSSVNGFVTKIQIDTDDLSGGCAVALSSNPKSKLAACGAWWLTFDCGGSYNDPIRAYRMLDQAQLALALNLPVRVHFDDSRILEGKCVAHRVDLPD